MEKKKMKCIVMLITIIMLTLISYMPNSYAIEDTRLQKLTITPEGTGLSPAFSGDIYQYQMTVESDVTSIEVKAEANHVANKVEITGTNNLEEGSNLVKVKVVAENGESSSYSIFVTRKSPSIGEMNIIPNVIEEEPNKALQVTGIILDEDSNLFIHPEYTPEIHDYTLELKGDATSIPLTVVANKQEAKIEIKGNENLADGKNTIEITVTDGQEELNYKIVVYKNIEYPQAVEEKPQLLEKQENEKGMIILIVTITVIVLISIGLAWRRRGRI